MNAATFDSLPPDATGIWRITTEHGTRIWLDLDEQRWLREPAESPDRPTNRMPNDGSWNRFGVGPFAWEPDALLDPTPPTVGKPLWLANGVNDEFTSTRVVAIETVCEPDAPPPVTITARRDPDGFWMVYGPRSPWVGTGETPEAAAVAFAAEVDEWLDVITKRRDTSRAARWWASKVDTTGSVRTWVLENAAEGRPQC